MREDSFRSRVIKVVVVLLVVSTLIGLLLFNSGPRVRSVKFDPGFSDTTITRGSTLTIGFDRPIRQDDYTQQLTFEPQLAFSTETTTQGIIVRFEQNLTHDQQYSLKLDGGKVVDTSDQAMNSTYQTSFTTLEPSIMYLDRNYGVLLDDGELIEEVDDTIYERTLSGESQEVFSHPRISLFSVNERYVLIAAIESSRDVLFVIDRETGEQREIELILEGRVNTLALSPRGGTGLISVSPDFDSVSREYFNEFNSTLISLELQSLQQQTLTNESDENVTAVWAQMNEDGQAALIQDLDQTFYVVSPFGDYDPIVIGSHTSSYGFDEGVSSILFRDNTNFSRYDIASAELEAISLPIDGFVQGLSFRNDDTIVSYLTEAPFELQEYEITRLIEDSEDELVWSTEGREDVRLREMSVSYDSNLYAIQLNASDCQFDQLTPNAECREPKTIVYDSQSREELFEFDGFDTVWLP